MWKALHAEDLSRSSLRLKKEALETSSKAAAVTWRIRQNATSKLSGQQLLCGSFFHLFSCLHSTLSFFQFLTGANEVSAREEGERTILVPPTHRQRDHAAEMEGQRSSEELGTTRWAPGGWWEGRGLEYAELKAAGGWGGDQQGAATSRAHGPVGSRTRRLRPPAGGGDQEMGRKFLHWKRASS